MPLTFTSRIGTGKPLKVRVKDILFQKDYAGLDCEDGSGEANIFCKKTNKGQSLLMHVYKRSQTHSMHMK